MKNNFRKAAATTICMLMVAVMSLTGVTYAWFTAGESATVNGMNMEVVAAAGGVQVRAQNDDTSWGPWASTVDLDTSVTSVDPVSSTDGENFFMVDFDDTDAGKYTTVAADAGNVITKKLQLKNPGATDITVVLDAANSKITSAANTSNANVETAIYGAARVALIVGDTTYIWAPNDTSYVGIYATTTTPFEVGAIQDGVSKNVTITAAEACEIVLPAIDAQGNETFVDVTLVVWLEGQDDDCVNKNAGGAFDVALQFVQKAAAAGN